MAQPAEYNRRKDFTDQDGDETDHNALNQEFDAAAQSINEIRDNLALIQKDDGSLANQSVGADQLQPGVFDAYQGELNQKVQEAKDASTQSTLSAVASAESAASAATSEENAARSESNAAASANNAANAAQYAFNGIYFGPHSDDPALDPNGDPPTDGDFYYNTVAKTWRTYDAQTGRWVSPILSGQFKRQIYAVGTDFTPGVTDVLALPSDPLTARNIFIHFDGIFQQASTFTLDGLNVEFDAPIPVGVSQVEVAYIEAVTVIITDALMSFATRAIAQAAVASIADGQAWEIRADENNGGKRTRGIVTSNVLVLKSIDDFADNQIAVKKTGNTGAAILPEGIQADRPDPPPADGLLVRGNTTTGKPEWYSRAVPAWKTLVDEDQLNASVQALDTVLQALDANIGFTIIYPNGGTQAAPANVAVNSRYVMPNPFPGYHVLCVVEIKPAGFEWGEPKFVTGTTGAGFGVRASVYSDSMVIQTGGGGLYAYSNVDGNPWGISSGTLNSVAPCRVKVYKLKG